ncbi:MAG: isoleucine--tRNA ligase [Candidatus Eisenbacteria sp.]|nr:isoleucine--tRNA ligase [Candidatus Eisenbacteria bacterium]
MFKETPPEPDLVGQEERILRFWDENRIFDKLRARNKGGPKFKFLDGPITANRPMGVHHAWGRTYKDIFQRYHAMLGHETRYQNGYDCQGLWIEIEIEKELGFNSKKEIERFGIDKFVKLCKERPLKISKEVDRQSNRLGYWMDWSDSYFTMSDENNYTIWYFIKKCHERGFVYKGHDVMPWCPRCGTAVSDHEIATEGYRELEHPSITIRLPIKGRENEYIMVWTTTPWTLTSNVALAVSPKTAYVKAVRNGETYYLAKSALERMRGELKAVEELTGDKLVGWEYEGPFDELPAQEGIVHRVLAWKEVDESEGTGVVHIAPGCGKEDFALGRDEGLPAVAPLDEAGRFIEGFGWLTGKRSEEAKDEILANLEKKGLKVDFSTLVHRYPVCWRCSSELVFRLVDEWFISMDKLRHEIMEVTRKIRWMPGFGMEREIDWLRNMHDWCISRKRYWGLALPIFECECGWFDVIGSREELEKRTTRGWDEFDGNSPHRPWVDEIRIKCEKCGKEISRIREVGNPWLDAGIVPFSTMGYRTDPDYWKEWYPSHFITECFPGQFRNWFYSLLAMSTVLENREPFQTVLGHALVLDLDGQEMHKSTGNVIWFDEAVDALGADVLRWIFARQNPFVNLNFGLELGEEVRRRFLKIWNSYGFFVTYARLDGITLEDLTAKDPKRTLLDRWILARLHQTTETCRGALDEYSVTPVIRALDAFVEDLSNWYIRANRRRFWKSGGDEDKRAAYATLWEALVGLVKLMSPILPFLSEEMYQNLVREIDPGAPESVHLTMYPEVDETLIDGALVAEMEYAARMISLGRAMRKEKNTRVRQPLSRMMVGPSERMKAEKAGTFRESVQRWESFILDELNIRKLEHLEDSEQLLEFKASPDFRLLGKKYGDRMPKIKMALEALPSGDVAQLRKGQEPLQIEVDGNRIELQRDEIKIDSAPREGLAVCSEGDIFVALDLNITDDLRREGLARELVHRIQRMRKEAGFEISDRIRIAYRAGDVVREIFETQGEYIARETLCEQLEEKDDKGEYRESLEIAGEKAEIAIARVTRPSS